MEEVAKLAPGDEKGVCSLCSKVAEWSVRHSQSSEPAPENEKGVSFNHWKKMDYHATEQ
jgi:hypothetical protein